MADIFRLLSRGSTLAKGATGGSHITTRKPTTTAAAAAAAPKKRSREQDGQVLPKELDFFGDAANVKKKPKVADADGDLSMDDTDGEEEVEGAEEDVGKRGNGELEVAEDDDAVRKLMWAHKLKYTLLTDPAANDDGGEDGAKQTKKKKKKHAQLLIPPLTSFAQLRSSAHGYALSRRVYENILAQGYTAPTEVQMGALPVLMKKQASGALSSLSGVDLLTCAPTGSGKTLAYVVPLLDWILSTRKESGGERGVRAVVLAPTKELAGQIVNEVKKLSVGTGVRVSLMRKGMAGTSVKGEEAGISVKSDILVSTPLLLLHAIEAEEKEEGKAGEFVGVRRLVLDEADVLLDELFRDQTLGIWRALKEGAEKDGGLRTSLWSATISSGTEEIARSMMLPSSAPAATITTLDEPIAPSPPSPKPEKSKKSKKSTKTSETAPEPAAPAPAPAATILRLIVGLKDTSLPTVKQTLLYTATEPGKLLALRQLFTTRFTPPALLFVQSIPRAQALYNEIQYDLPTPGRIAVLHASLTDTMREEVMDRFRRGDIWVLITTDLLARGVDFKGVRLVINYDIPTTVVAYIHRVGRTGRAGREGGEAVTYYTKEDVGYVKGIANVIAVSQGEQGKGEGKVGKWLLDALPKVGRRERKELKRKGVKARAGTDAKGTARISTKSGYERQRMDRKRGAVEASKRRTAEAAKGGGSGGESEREEEFMGIEE
ncbi:P-loop containing nucleoside triphosphate hydrolase protein [Morchella snyderi]|nr:P-loop containing nucleoside triphosphate hydrolase protein [Morchella snyderi]